MKTPLIWLAALALLLMSGCGMAEKNLEEAQNDPVEKFPLEATIPSVELKGDMYVYAFSITNKSKDKPFEGAIDIELVLGSKSSSMLHNIITIDIPPQQKYVFGLESPIEPGPDGYNWFVFRAYDPMDNLLVRQAYDVPAVLEVGS